MARGLREVAGRSGRDAAGAWMEGAGAADTGAAGAAAGAVGLTAADGLDAAEVPCELLAFTVKV